MFIKYKEYMLDFDSMSCWVEGIVVEQNPYCNFDCSMQLPIMVLNNFMYFKRTFAIGNLKQEHLIENMCWQYLYSSRDASIVYNMYINYLADKELLS